MQNDVEVTYCLTSDLDDAVIAAAVEQLSSEERARHDRLLFARDRRDFALAHALLRRSLSECCGCAPHELTFTSSPRGKPALRADLIERNPVSFNLAHTDGLVACVVARDAEVGVDVEAIERRVDVLKIADRYFSPAEVADVRRCTEDARHARFIESWTLKEAYVKALGEGLALPLDEFTFVFEGESSLRFESSRALPHAVWSFALFAPSDRHRMAVAVASAADRERRVTVRADLLNGRPVRDAELPLRASTFDAACHRGRPTGRSRGLSTHAKAGEQLPSVRRMAEDLLINPNTVVRAYRDLESEGIVELRHGSGVFVRDSVEAPRGRDAEGRTDRAIRPGPSRVPRPYRRRDSPADGERPGLRRTVKETRKRRA